MSAAAFDFFEVTLIRDVTVIKLLDAAEYCRDHSKDVELAPLIYRMGGPLPPQTLEIWERLRNDLLMLLETDKPQKVVLDFAGLDRIGYQAMFSSAINSACVAAKSRSEAFGCQWRLCGFTEHARAFYESSWFPKMFPDVHDSQADAVAAFAK